MTTQAIKIQILKHHYIQVKTDGYNILADNEYVQNGEVHHEWVNVTSWSQKRIYNWLGY